MLTPGTLWTNIRQTTAQALNRGALQPLATKSTFVEQRGIRFLVRILSNLQAKEKARQAGPQLGRIRANPFLPYDESLFVADISATHVALLNKFNVVDHHLLLVTRVFEDQESLLSRQDFHALWLCLQEFEGLGFYNAGAIAGASQRHKHLQYVPLPLAAEGPAIPIEPLLNNGRLASPVAISPGLPFTHALAPVGVSICTSPQQAADALLASYRTLLRTLGLVHEDQQSATTQLAPYNLLITRNWMLIVPRSCEYFQSISINGLGFAGTLLVRNEQQLQLLQDYGPLNALQHVAGSSSSTNLEHRGGR